MMKYLAVAGLALMSTSLAYAEAPLRFVPLGYVQITSLSSPAPLPSIPTGASMAIICVDTAAVRWRDDGTNPTASVGMPLTAGQCFAYTSALSAIRFILQSGSPVLNVSYYR